MKKIKLFLASSSELKEDWEQFEIFIYRKCKAWFDRGIFLHLVAFNKVGPYTAEEFSHAFGQFSETKKPFIFTYFKTPTTTQNREDLQSLWAFEDKLKELKHYKTEYPNIEGLREHFGNQLEKLAAKEFAILEPDRLTKQEAEKPTSQTTTVTKTYNIKHINEAKFE